MNFGLDYDGTFTAAPELWLSFVANARRLGHQVYVVTMRYPSEACTSKVWEMLVAQATAVIYTSREAKGPVVDSFGVKIHVWIDDNPRAVNESAAQIWPGVTPEGHLITPTHDD